MADEQQFCLRWNNFQMNITSQFEALRDEEDFVDVTLACEGQRLKAHKVVLSACSPYFKELFKSNPCKHPILFMRDVEFRHLKSLVEFMYAGEVNVAQAQLSAFLRTAESLQIRGLTEAPQRHSRFDGATSDTGHSRRGTRSGIPTSPIAGAPEEDDILSLSPPASPSPPAKRPCTAPDPANIKREAPDIVEPKLEVPDYSSDGESRTESGNGAHYGGIENPLDAKSAYATGGLQGGMEMIPGTSAAHNFLSDVSTLPQEPASQAGLACQETVWAGVHQHCCGMPCLPGPGTTLPDTLELLLILLVMNKTQRRWCLWLLVSWYLLLCCNELIELTIGNSPAVLHQLFSHPLN
ncbi:broad-complex core protein isoforms 1/2/3/4/5-like isoform X5 [Schistocerca gregaria]|uniref:broad-complex core protein isoforms 1/2/3/4/5-like isoform X5 n=1 Tax=Schistocerca gregaria TaxID=7010 RepID=UPI00211E86CF|nr:broad-complex core protein isoforms 1/2/3/4/5-like isoform X5 [Schistocerca gregaria]